MECFWFEEHFFTDLFHVRICRGRWLDFGGEVIMEYYVYKLAVTFLPHGVELNTVDHDVLASRF